MMTRYPVLTKYDEGLDAPPMAEWDPDGLGTDRLCPLRRNPVT